MSDAADTKTRLRAAAIDTVRDLGIAGVSARTVASRAECNQASIYYHFGSLHGLLN
jgi:AcrR family transcriptional regulator